MLDPATETGFRFDALRSATWNPEEHNSLCIMLSRRKLHHDDEIQKIRDDLLMNLEPRLPTNVVQSFRQR